MTYTNLTQQQFEALKALGRRTGVGLKVHGDEHTYVWCEASAKKRALVIELVGLPDDERKVATPPPSALPSYDFRTLVLEGSVSVGGRLMDGTVVSLGKAWRLTERNVDMGERPDWEGRSVQYAYVAR